MQTSIRCRDDQGNIIMSMREEKIKSFADVTKDFEHALIIVGIVAVVILTIAVALL